MTWRMRNVLLSRIKQIPFPPPKVDGYMNVTLSNATLVDPARTVSARLDSIMVQNRLIRFAQIPAEIDVKAELQRRFGPKQRGRGEGATQLILVFSG